MCATKSRSIENRHYLITHQIWWNFIQKRRRNLAYDHKRQLTSKKGHVTKIEKVSLGTSSRQDYQLTHQIWWNLVQKQLRNQPGQGFEFFVTFDLDP